ACAARYGTSPERRGPVNSPADPEPPAALLQAANGTRWRTAGHTPDGEPLYVPDSVDPDTCPMWARAAEHDVVEAAGPLTQLTEGAR
ncbi:hypothetical protein ACFVDH_22085, partial [Streptomyces sp. NPDC057674]|uniref:hypothetical protein n=1 Tax=Streptomyces sp. NPDC057674 TaxID=3346203 RepID=UPI0036825C6F